MIFCLQYRISCKRILAEVSIFCLRQAVAAKAGVDPQSELDFTTDRIETNFSNYSAWHYRSKLLPLVHPSDSKVKSSNENSFPVAEEAHHKELDLVQNAAFTDPDDSSAWLYHAWLAGRGKKTPAVIWISSGNCFVCEIQHYFL